MQIRKKWAGHDYPFFYGQHEDLLKVLDFEYPAYKASRKDVLASKRPSPVKASDEPEDIVFIPFAPKYWKYMDKMYRHYAGDDNCRVWVVPVPYYYKAWDGSMSEEMFDRGDDELSSALVRGYNELMLLLASFTDPVNDTGITRESFEALIRIDMRNKASGTIPLKVDSIEIVSPEQSYITPCRIMFLIAAWGSPSIFCRSPSLLISTPYARIG